MSRAGPWMPSPPIDLRRPDPELLAQVVESEPLRELAPSLFLLLGADPERIPDDSFQKLRLVHLANRFLCEARHAELQRRLEAFAAESIPAIPLKGTHLAERLYDDVGGRPLGVDLDLLVRPEDAARAAGVLERDGYRALGPSDRYDRPFLRAEPDGSTTHVELHREPLPRWFGARGLGGAWWSRARPPDADRSPAWSMDPGDELLYLCAHLAKDQIESHPGLPHLRHGLDIHLALERWGPAIDWRDFVERSRAFHLHAYAALALEFVGYWFGASVPEPVASELPDWKRAVFRSQVWPLAPPPRGVVPLRKELRLLALVLLLDDAWTARLGHLAWAGSELRSRLRGLRGGAWPSREHAERGPSTP